MYNQVLTNSGAALLRDAVNAQKKIVFTRAICGSNYDMDSRGDLAAKPIDWYNGATGSISGVSAKASGLTVIAEFSAIESGTDPVKSACICVQIKKDGVSPEYDPADDVIFAAWCDDNSAYVSGDSISIKFELPIALSSLVDDSGSTSGDFVTLDTAQEITASKSVHVEDWKITIGPTLRIEDSTVEENPSYIDLGDVSGEYCSGGAHEPVYFEYEDMVFKTEYSTTNKTVDLTLGDGTKIRLTCTNVEEV
jgi:hypothetical protein